MIYITYVHKYRPSLRKVFSLCQFSFGEFWQFLILCTSITVQYLPHIHIYTYIIYKIHIIIYKYILHTIIYTYTYVIT